MPARTTPFFFSFFLLLLCAGKVVAQYAGRPDTLLLRQEYVVLPPLPATAKLAQLQIGTAGENLLLQTDRPISTAAAVALQSMGGSITGRFEKGIVSVYVANAASLENLQKAVGIRTIQPFKNNWKIEPTLAKSGNVKVVITHLPAATAEVKNAIASAGGSLLPNASLPSGMLEATVPAGALPQLAALPKIFTLGRASERIPLNMDERGYSGATTLSQPLAAGGKGLDGAGMVVGIGDNTPPFTHIDLADRTVNFNPLPLTQHGIHVSGTLAGSGIINPAARGMAPAANLVSQSFDGIVFQAPEYQSAYGLTITNNSYASTVGSCNFAGIYDAYSAAIDRMAETNPEVLHIFAAGNDGTLACISTPGFGNIPGGYQPAKNNLVVGNVQKDMKVRRTSSKGPLPDGRLKPEICAFGTSVFSTFPNNTYSSSTGTSMASPAITGAATLLSQRYKQLKNGLNPKGLLLKALLTGTADDLGNAGPDFSYGFGMFSLSRAVAALEENRFAEGFRTLSAASNYGTINVPAGLASLKVTLVWNDLPSSLAAQQQLVADLNLRLQDPNGNSVLPLVLNPQSPESPAVPGVDSRNNIEQVVVPAPTAGSYTIVVEGPAATTSPVPFTLVWDFVAPGVRLLQPAAGIPVKAGAPLNVFWEAPAGTGDFTLSYSSDSGANWIGVATVADTNRVYEWNVPGSATRAGFFRVQRGSYTSIQGPFVVNESPVVTPGTQQCPGYFSFNWNAVASAATYQILQRRGREMVPIDTITGTSYFLSGLPLSETQYVAVAPLISGKAGYRSDAVFRTPNTGSNCGAIAANDLMILPGSNALTGRLATGTALSATENVAVKVRNLGNVAVSGYVVSYRVGSGTWLQTPPQSPLAGGDSATVALAQRDFSAVGSYVFQAAVVNTAATDPVHTNDSLRLHYRQLPNAPVALNPGFTEDFEMPERLTLTGDSAGLFQNSRWDYARFGALFGRARNYVEGDIVISGSRSLSLDADRSNNGARNEVTGTFNLSTASLTTDEIRMEADYILHGKPKDSSGTGIRLRGTDALNWLPVFTPDTLQIGAVHNTGSISLSDALLAGGQSLSSSTALQIVQDDTTTISTISYGRGFTVDNLKLYTVQNDVALLAIDTPLNVACDLSNSVPLRVIVANGMRQTQTNIPLYFRLDSGAVQTAVLAQLLPKDTVVFTFPQTLAAGAPGEHRLDVWAANAADSYHQNDSLVNFRFRNQPLIDSFPYIENFEAGKGNWYTDKTGSSWEWGTPLNRGINKAASGTKAWKTGLASGYKDNEESYLYSPCFSVFGLNTPMMSISLAYDLENCGNAICDEAYAEWTTDGQKWHKLGLSVEGYNWYDSLQHRAWTAEGKFNWRVATTPLPIVPEPIRFRFVLKSDGGSTREGIAVDDIHIYDKGQPVFTGDFARISREVPDGKSVVFSENNTVIAQLSGSSNALGTVEIQSFRHPLFVDAFTAQLFLPQSFTVKTGQPVQDSVAVAFYISDSVVQLMAPFSELPGIAKAPDAYRLGILRYDALDKSKEDSSLANNTAGLYQYRQPADVIWVPYDSGYIARFPAFGFSEFWFAPTGPTVAFPPADVALQLQVRRQSRDVAALGFTSSVDSNVSVYEVERAIAGRRDFEKVATITARHESGLVRYALEDQPPAVDNDTVLYRIRWRLLDGTYFRSSPQSVLWTPEYQVVLYPNPVTGGALNIRYTASPGSKLEVQLTDIMGRLILKDAQTATVYDNLFTLPVALPAGIYILKGSLGGKTFTQKVLSR